MQLLKRVVTIIALVYLLVALLLLFFPFVRTSSVGLFGVYSLPLEINLLLGFTWGGVIVVGLLLIFENLDSGLLRRTIDQKDKKINELKAQLFDVKAPLGASAVSYPLPPSAGPAPTLPPPSLPPPSPTPLSY